jgi:hypothetical protein
MGGSSYNRAQSSKNRANVFETVKHGEYLFRLGSTAVSLRHLFCFITYHTTSCVVTSVNMRMFFSVVVLWIVSDWVVSSLH